MKTAPELLREAQWITIPTDAGEPGTRPAYWFRRFFDLTSPVADATLYATAHGLYEAFVNGTRVGDEELAPGFTNYRRTLHVQRYDLRPYLREGTNELRFLVSDGWYRGRCGPFRIADNFGDQIAVVGALTVDDAPAVTTDATWGAAVSHITAADLMDGQTTDHRRIGLEQWEPAEVSRDPLTQEHGRLQWSPAPPARRTEEYRPVSIDRLPSGRVIVDFGQNLNGWTRLSTLGRAGTELVLVHGEALGPAGDVSQHNLEFAIPQWQTFPAGQKDVVISRGEPGDVFEPRHTTHGFRYVAIDGLPEAEQIDITAVQVRTDMTHIGSFACSDERLNSLHAITVASWRSNSCDIPTDCPQRERWGYTGDFQIFIRSAAYLDDLRGFGQKWLQSLADDQNADGRITNVSPNCGALPVPDDSPLRQDGAAGWGDAATIVPWELYRQYGDIDILRRTYPMMRRWIGYVQAQAATRRHPSREEAHPAPRPHDAYVWDTGWQWGEWLEPGGQFDPTEDQGIVATAYFARSADIVAQAADILGEHHDADELKTLASAVRDAWRKEFIGDDGTLRHPSQANYVRAITFGLIPENLLPASADKLIALIRENGNRLSTGFLSTGMLLPVLADIGRADLAFAILLQSEEPSWMTMLERGATTVWEEWGGVDADGAAHGSLNHYSKGAVISFLHEYVAGIRPAQPGYAEIEISPLVPPGVTWATASHHTPHGVVTVRWHIEGDQFALEAETPEVPTLIRLPSGAVHSVSGGRHLFQEPV
ncbi:family 78 glycoside hydrolase catalytic domain [Nonomuraea sp. CA-143628]|uniref:family 78 glycoside hydrolase catalytic domain n=1 Tax=Nonomuraea sp. CA-143628 TaxID=3239997 RepID=UPI003D911307